MYFQLAGEILQLTEVVRFLGCFGVFLPQLLIFGCRRPTPPHLNSSVEILVPRVVVSGGGARGR